LWRRRFELRQKIGGPHDRTGYELRKERHVQQHVDRSPADRHLAAIHIGDVGDAVKRVERDPDGQDDLEERQLACEAEQLRQLVRRDDEEVEIFEYAQQAEMDRHPGRQCGALAARIGAGRNQPAGDIAHRGAKAE
jgi:hypothetical protein